MTFTKTPIYKASSVVIVDSNQVNVIDLGSVLSGGGLNTAVMDTEVKVMGSKSLLKKVVIRENLTEDPEYNPRLVEYEPGIVDAIKGFLPGSSDAEEPDPFMDLSPEEREAEEFETAVNRLMRNVSVRRVGTTYLMTAEVRSTSPKTAARLANAVAEQYRVEQLETRLEATQTATEWLSGKTEGMRRDLAARERAVEQFRADSGLLIAEGTSLTETQLAMLEQQRLQLETDLSRVQGRYDNMRRQMQNGGNVDNITEVLSSTVISDLKSQRATALRRVAELQTTLLSQHPDLASARSQVADIDRQIRSEAARITSNLESEVRVARDRVAEIRQQIGASRGQLMRDNRSLVRLRELEREATSSRQLYEEFDTRFKETREQNDLVQPDARILSSATVPNSPSSPRTMLNLIIGILLGGVIGAAVALISELFDSKLESSEEIERTLGVHAIGTVPLIRTSGFLGFGKKIPADYMVSNPMSAYAESVRYLRAAIAFSDIDANTQVVTMTSSLPDEGKTSLTLSLGRMSAMSGTKTLVIDGDFRRRQLTEAAGLNPEVGFVEYLFGKGQLDQAILRDSKTELDVLALSLDGHSPHDVFGTQAFDVLLSHLRTVYDLILIDTGPVLLMAEARIIASKSDKTILAVRWRHSKRQTVRKSIKLLRSFKADILGVSVNMVDLSQRRQNTEAG
ncbi:MAG: AAA family ATPase, partial [Henriciella sp.]|nr:AAA family ATPase [Henriciella sp.]